MKFKKRDVGCSPWRFRSGHAGLEGAEQLHGEESYVQGVAKGLQAKAAYQDVVEQAKAQVDDIVAEASYINESAKAEQPAVDGE